MSTDLKLKQCIPCQGGVPPLSKEAKETLLIELDSSWLLTHDGSRLKRELKFKDMASPMKLAEKIAKMADDQWHHPELHVGYGHMEIEIWTHKINNLVESDFIFAAKVDEIITTSDV